MQEGGAILGRVRQELKKLTQVGISPAELEAHAQKLIKSHGAEVSFDKVPGYKWATCINLNEGIVHGIPTSTIAFVSGDMVTVDVGVYYEGYHTDSAYTVVVGESTPAQDTFLEAGLYALKQSIQVVTAGARVGDISFATGEALKKYGVYPTKELTGHGVGRELHEQPMIPNLLLGKIEQTPQLVVGQTIAIEVIYTSKPPSLYLEKDGWTISSRNDKLTAVFEETVQVREDGFLILTVPSLFQMYSSGTISKI